MPQWLKIGRAVAGVLSVMALLVMMIMQFLYEGLTLSQSEIGLMLLLIGGLLGVDVLLEEKLQISIKKEESEDD